MVAIKYIEYNDAHEIEIAQFLTSIKHPDNHCVPVLDTFTDPLDPRRTLLVMPWLRPYDDPEFAVVGEVIDFADQMLKVSGDKTYKSLC